MSEHPNPEIQLDFVEQLLEEALTDVRKLDGYKPVANANSGQRREWQASANRHLLNLADRIALAEAAARNEYWRLKGMPNYEL